MPEESDMVNNNNGKQIRKIELCLSKYLPPDTAILHHVVKQLTAPGENYGSIILAVDVTIQTSNSQPKVLHLVAKTRPANEMLCEMFQIHETFYKEISMYVDVIPLLSKFQKEHSKGGRNYAELFAKSYGGRLNLKPGSNYVDEDAVLFLENLKVPGYETGDRLIGFDEVHVYRILEDLARFHAVPIAFKMQNPEEFERTIRPIVKGVAIGKGTPENLIQRAVDEMIGILKDNIKCVPYLEKIKKIMVTGLLGTVRLYESTEPFATIVHSDYWVNNTMILRNETGKPIKNKIVDLQLPCYNNGALDLLFFIFTSIQPKILYQNVDKFIKLYYKYFLECLQEFDVNLKPFSYDKFYAELKRIAPIELGDILVMHKPIFTKRGAISDMAELELDALLGPSLMSDDYISRILNCVLCYIDNGWLDDDIVL